MAKSRAEKKLSYDDLVTQLRSVKREHDKFVKGQRKTLYQFLQRSAEMALSAEADKTIVSRFRQEVGEKDVLRGVLIFIFDAKSEAELKEVSKRASALRYLVEKLEVSVDDIATAIPKHGGIEKLAGLAAKSRKIEEEGSNDQGDEDQRDEGRGTEDEEDQDDIEQKHDLEVAEKVDEANPKFGKLLEVGLSPKHAKKLNGLADKARIKLVGRVRISGDDAPIVEVEKFITKFKKQTERRPR